MNWRTKSESRLEKMGEKITLHPKKNNPLYDANQYFTDFKPP